MAKLQSGNLAGGLTHIFEFNYEDLKNPGFLSTSGALTGSTVNPAQTFGADGQKIVATFPRGSNIYEAGIVCIEAAAGASDLGFFLKQEPVDDAILNSITADTATLIDIGEFDNRAAGFNVANNGIDFRQSLSQFVTDVSSGLDGLTGGTDAENGAAAALALYNNRNKSVFERSPFGHRTFNDKAQTVYFQINGTVSNLTAGRWLIYLRNLDVMSLANGFKPDKL
jgi:hypothetical protein